MPRSLRAAVVLTAALVVSSAGCGRSGPERFSLKGRVTFDGAPLAEGDILLLPASGTQAPTVSGRIENGEFNIPADRGPMAGDYTVAISAERKTGRKVQADILGSATTEQYEQYIPARYNEQTTLSAQIDRDRDDLSFELSSKR